VFWVISVYFNIRNTFPKSGTFLLGHPIYIYIYIYTHTHTHTDTTGIHIYAHIEYVQYFKYVTTQLGFFVLFQADHMFRPLLGHLQVTGYIIFEEVTFFFVALRPNAGHGLLILEVSRSHTTTHHSR